MTNTQTLAHPPISADLQTKIDRFLKKVREKTAQSGLKFEPLDDGSGYCGTYHTGFSARKNDDRSVVFHISFIDGEGNKSGSIDYSFPSDSEDAKIAKAALDKMLGEECKLFSYSTQESYLSSFEDKELGYLVRRELKKDIESKYPDEFFLGEGRKYTCTVDTELPHRASTFTRGHMVKVGIRQDEDRERIKNKYIKRPTLHDSIISVVS